MSSHSSDHDALDTLIASVLQECVGEAEPSSEVWEQISAQANAWSGRQTARSGWRWDSFLVRNPQPDSDFDLPVAGFVAARDDLATIKLIGFAGLIFRFAW